ncbi:MAG TPA: hypothetical protein VMX76_01425 [Nevskiaceae bacterium]|nr:hypothetical protein [Nevskiaceae bacterium]
MSSAEREKIPLYGYDYQLWLIDPETSEKRSWIGNYSSGFLEGAEIPQKKDSSKLKAPEDPTAAKGWF